MAKVHTHSLKCIDRAGELVCADSYVSRGRERGHGEKMIANSRDIDQVEVANLRVDAARRKAGVIVLPRHQWGVSQANAPGRHATIAQYTDAHGVTFKLSRSGGQSKRFHLSAGQGDYRVSNAIATSSPEKAKQWEQAIQSGTIELGS